MSTKKAALNDQNGLKLGAGLGFEPRTNPLKHWEGWIIVDLSLTM
jgi:hypothetical protein